MKFGLDLDYCIVIPCFEGIKANSNFKDIPVIQTWQVVSFKQGTEN